MEGHDHSRCPIELRACPEHEVDQLSGTEFEEGAAIGVQSDEARGSSDVCGSEPMKDGWVPLAPTPPDIEVKFEEWAASERESIGFCFLCGGPIDSEADLISGTNTHNCPEGRSFEAKIGGGN